MDAQILKTIKEATANSFRRSLTDIFRTILPLCPQLCEGLTVTMAEAAELFDKVPQHQSDIDILTDQLTNTGTAQTPEDHADLPDLDMEMDPSHQSTSSTADPPPSSSETSTNSWKLSKAHTLTTPASAICLRQA
ncbi:hypothetical protein RCL_jg5363.t1 [Rhizophagus clarus]|uniref:Uncharacterized protein n=1 Tax=Rhizophagus clarus TaxID=94130 RepID=A0A8H3QR65_9GLOM|nr:hypothetical protein RCL_jg5363.t1 [Rhizophagus clarus]